MKAGDPTVISRRDRIAILIVIGLAALGTLLVGAMVLRAAGAASVQLNVSHAGPRAVEEQTERAILRDYGAAWTARATALEHNDPAALGELWVGFARTDLNDAIAAQRQSGISVRYVDHGHHAEAVFYSSEGSALELHDTAQLERQILDGGTVIDSEPLLAYYVVVMTPTSDHWQVRALQAVPNF